MLKDITLGQYFPGDSVVHQLDPRSKLIAVVIFIACIFTARSMPSQVMIHPGTMGVPVV